jgi:hypothetical protein
MLENHWDEERQHTYPNLSKYPHQWLWDSCFASICWSVLGYPERAVQELSSALSSQFEDGFVPHMRYARPNKKRGPLSNVSSYTQPPMYAHAARVISNRSSVPADLVAKISSALEWLWNKRRADDGLIFIVHPWESGADDSPRWDSWITAREIKDLHWNRMRWSRFDKKLVHATRFDLNGEAVSSSAFKCAPAGFNVLACHAAQELANLNVSTEWVERSNKLAEAIDATLWDAEQGLWSDAALTGGGQSTRIPTLDGVLGALVTRDKAKATRSLDQLLDPTRFAAPYGLAYVARNHSSYNPDEYWRGTAWMQMNYLAALAARRWGREEIVDSIHSMSQRAALKSGLAEHWNPESGEGRGAIPLTWSALVMAI